MTEVTPSTAVTAALRWQVLRLEHGIETSRPFRKLWQTDRLIDRPTDRLMLAFRWFSFQFIFEAVRLSRLLQITVSFCTSFTELLEFIDVHNYTTLIIPCVQVYHLYCYIPALENEPPDDWCCIMCETREGIFSVSVHTLSWLLDFSM